MARRRQSLTGLLTTIVVILLTAAQQQGWLDPMWRKLESNQPGLYTVKQVSDGDTIVIDMNGHEERIRLIGVDTPETHKPNAPVQCYGPAASAFTKRTIDGHRVRLVSDPLSTNRDRYDRLLRYVYLDDGRFINELLIQDGYGFYYPYFPFTKSQTFAAAQASAQTEHKGLWRNCSPEPTDGGGYRSNPL
jgi:micrococcal nuclease